MCKYSITQTALTCSKSKTETLKIGVKQQSENIYIRTSSINFSNVFTVTFKQISYIVLAFPLPNLEEASVFGMHLGYGSSRKLMEAVFIFTNSE